jgi:hypothetical protein
LLIEAFERIEICPREIGIRHDVARDLALRD